MIWLEQLGAAKKTKAGAISSGWAGRFIGPSARRARGSASRRDFGKSLADARAGLHGGGFVFAIVFLLISFVGPVDLALYSSLLLGNRFGSLLVGNGSLRLSFFGHQFAPSTTCLLDTAF